MNIFNSFFFCPCLSRTDLIEQKPASTAVDCLNLNCCDLSFVKYRYLINFAESKTRKFVDYIYLDSSQLKLENHVFRS